MELDDLLDKISHLDDPPPTYVTLKAKKLAVLMKVPNELIQFSSPDIEAIFHECSPQPPPHEPAQGSPGKDHGQNG